MKDFAGSSITYYGLAREKLMNKYPKLISVLVILALICMTGLAIFLISDLVSFASNQDHKDALVGLDLKGPENGIVPMTDGKEKSGNISTNSSRSLENVSRQTKEQNVANLSKKNASLPSGQEVVAASKSSSSSSRNSVDKSGNSPVIKHHSSSSSSSSSSAKSAKKSSDKNNLINETIASPTPTNQSMNKSQEKESGFVNATSSNLSNEGQSSVLSDQERANSQVAAGAIFNPAKDTLAREPVSIIKFKTKATISPKSDQGQKSSPVVDNSKKAQSSKDTTKKTNSKAIGTKKASSQKSKVTASSQAKKAQEVRDKLKANKNRIAENMKKKAAKSRAKTASN
ncbi:MAG: hypothetical protein WCW68_07800 [Methanothrix sp.]